MLRKSGFINRINLFIDFAFITAYRRTKGAKGIIEDNKRKFNKGIKKGNNRKSNK